MEEQKATISDTIDDKKLETINENNKKRRSDKMNENIVPKITFPCFLLFRQTDEEQEEKTLK